MDFVIRQHMLLKEERKWLGLCVGGSKVTFYSEKPGQFMQVELRQTESERVCYRCVFYPYMNFEFNVCSYSLTSCVNLRCHSETDSGPELNMSAPFIPAAMALPFTSCHKGQRAVTFGVQPSHWIIHDIDLYFPLFFPLVSFFFFGQHTWLCCGRLLFI